MINHHFSQLMKVLMTLLALGWGLSAHAAKPPEIKELGATDKYYLSAQRTSLDDLARTHLGRQLRDKKDDDLALLQLLLDRQIVRAHQTRELQAMGVIMGNFLAEELNMHWVIYEDKVGRSRALRYQDSDLYLFPMTMISRRQEVDNRASVADVYQKAVNIIKPALPRAPYQ